MTSLTGAAANLVRSGTDNPIRLEAADFLASRVFTEPTLHQFSSSYQFWPF